MEKKTKQKKTTTKAVKKPVAKKIETKNIQKKPEVKNDEAKQEVNKVQTKKVTTKKTEVKKVQKKPEVKAVETKKVEVKTDAIIQEKKPVSILALIVIGFGALLLAGLATTNIIQYGLGDEFGYPIYSFMITITLLFCLFLAFYGIIKKRPSLTLASLFPVLILFTYNLFDDALMFIGFEMVGAQAVILSLGTIIAGFSALAGATAILLGKIFGKQEDLFYLIAKVLLIICVVANVTSMVAWYWVNPVTILDLVFDAVYAFIPFVFLAIAKNSNIF